MIYSKYNGPKKHRPKWLGKKGVSKKQIAKYLQEHREKYPEYYTTTCEHKTTMLIRGNWGPHRAKQVCVDCDKHIQWVKTQQNPYEKRTGSKYQYGSNTSTKGCAVEHNENSRSHVYLGIQHP